MGKERGLKASFVRKLHGAKGSKMFQPLSSSNLLCHENWVKGRRREFGTRAVFFFYSVDTFCELRACFNTARRLKLAENALL